MGQAALVAGAYLTCWLAIQVAAMLPHLAVAWPHLVVAGLAYAGGQLLAGRLTGKLGLSADPIALPCAIAAGVASAALHLACGAWAATGPARLLPHLLAAHGAAFVGAHVLFVIGALVVERVAGRG